MYVKSIWIQHHWGHNIVPGMTVLVQHKSRIFQAEGDNIIYHLPRMQAKGEGDYLNRRNPQTLNQDWYITMNPDLQNPIQEP